jgi:hypothetical protein
MAKATSSRGRSRTPQVPGPACSNVGRVAKRAHAACIPDAMVELWVVATFAAHFAAPPAKAQRNSSLATAISNREHVELEHAPTH